MNWPFAIHTRISLCVCILPIISLSLCAQSNAKATRQVQITNVRVGTVPIVIPSPTTELVEPGPDYRVIFETFAPVNNRLVAAFVPQDALDAIHKGKELPLDRYAMIEVARKTEFDEADSATFQILAEALKKQFAGDISPSASKGQAEANHNLKAMGSSTTVTIDKPVPLGTFFSMTDAIGVGSITPYTVNGATTRRASCLTFLHVRGRVLSVFLYAVYKDEGTVQWVKTTSEQWASAILKANE